MEIPEKLFKKTWADLTDKQKRNIGVSKSEFKKLKIEKGYKTPEFDFSKRWKGLDDSVKKAWEAKGKDKNDWGKARVDAGHKEDPDLIGPQNPPDTPVKPELKIKVPEPTKPTEPTKPKDEFDFSQFDFSQRWAGLDENLKKSWLASGRSKNDWSESRKTAGYKEDPDLIGPQNPPGTPVKPQLTIKVPDTDDGNKVGEGKDEGKDEGGDDDYVPEFPEGVSGKEIKKYKTQGKEIRQAAKEDLERRLKESFDPTKMVKAEKIKTAFKTGRKERKERLSKIEEGVSKPKFKRYKKNVKEIREGKGPAKEFGYSGKFERLGKSLGIEYGAGARAERTDERITRLRKGIGTPKTAYKTAAESFETQKKKGKDILKRFKGEMQ